MHRHDQTKGVYQATADARSQHVHFTRSSKLRRELYVVDRCVLIRIRKGLLWKNVYLDGPDMQVLS
jgi:hypothetical protein